MCITNRTETNSSASEKAAASTQLLAGGGLAGTEELEHNKRPFLLGLGCSTSEEDFRKAEPAIQGERGGVGGRAGEELQCALRGRKNTCCIVSRPGVIPLDPLKRCSHL